MEVWSSEMRQVTETIILFIQIEKCNGNKIKKNFQYVVRQLNVK